MNFRVLRTKIEVAQKAYIALYLTTRYPKYITHQIIPHN